MARLVATDIDGTLLRSDGTLSARSRAAIQRAQAQGLPVVLVSGRPPRWIEPVAAAAGLSGLAVCANGALVTDIATGELVACHTLAAEVAARIVEGLRAAVAGVTFAVETGRGFAREPGYEVLFDPVGELPSRDALALLELPVAKLIVKRPGTPVPELARIAAELADGQAEVTYSSTTILEISGAGITKASGLADVALAVSVAAEAVVSFGDMPNDVPMIAWAGRGIAVANAHPEVIEVADETTASNDEDGVALVLERLLAG